MYHVFFTNASRFNAKMKIKPILNPNKQYQSQEVKHFFKNLDIYSKKNLNIMLKPETAI